MARWTFLSCLVVLVGCASEGTSGSNEKAKQFAVAAEPQFEPSELGVTPSMVEYIHRAGKLMDQEPAGKGFPMGSVIWPMNEISVGWENPGDDTKTERGWVQDAVTKSWPQSCAVKFTGWGKSDANTNIRILIDDSHPHTKGMGRSLNKAAPGMVLNLTFKTWKYWKGGPTEPPSPFKEMTSKEYAIRNIAVHEFGHALGLDHEQNREDAPEYAKKCGSGNTGGQGGDFKIGAWDKDSCMNYANPKWQNQGMLSPTDKLTIGFLYPKDADIKRSVAGYWVGGARNAVKGLTLSVDIKQVRTGLSGRITIQYEENAEEADGRKKVVYRRLVYPLVGRLVQDVTLLYADGAPFELDLSNTFGASTSDDTRLVLKPDGSLSMNGNLQPTQDDVNAAVTKLQPVTFLPKQVFMRLQADNATLKGNCNVQGTNFIFDMKKQ